MSQDADEKGRIERLARRMSDDARIATPALAQLLRSVDAEIADLRSVGQPVPVAVSELRAIMALACAQRQAGGGASADGTRTTR